MIAFIIVSRLVPLKSRRQKLPNKPKHQRRKLPKIHRYYLP